MSLLLSVCLLVNLKVTLTSVCGQVQTLLIRQVCLLNCVFVGFVCLFVYILKIQKGKVPQSMECPLQAHSSPLESRVQAPQGSGGRHTFDLWLRRVWKRRSAWPWALPLTGTWGVLGVLQWRHQHKCPEGSPAPVSIQVWLPACHRALMAGSNTPITRQESQWHHQLPIRAPGQYERIMLPHWVDRVSVRGKNIWHFLSLGQPYQV